MPVLIKMMSKASAVFLCCLVNSVICVPKLEVDDNLAETENSLQDLTIKTNTSGSEDNNTFTESKSNLELQTTLTKDIRRKIDDLKELKNAFKRVETDFFGNNSKKPEKSDNLSLRTIRAYPFNQKEHTYQHQNLNSKFSNDKYLNRKYQYDPYPKTYENTGSKGGVQYDHNEVAQDKSLHSEEGMKFMLEPFVTTSPFAKSAQPVHSTSAVVELHNPVYITSQNPHDIHIHQVTPYYSQVPLFYESKEIILPGTVFSKQITLGPLGDFGNCFSNKPSGNKPLFDYPYGEIPYPYYASIPYGYTGGAYKYYTDTQFYNYPEAQLNYFGSFYNPGFYNEQAHPHTDYSAPALSQGKKNSEYPTQQQLDSLMSLTQISEDDSSRREVLNAVDKNTLLDQQDIKTDEKTVTLQDLSPSSADDKDSFISWLDGEVNNLYSRWMRLKENMKSEEV